MVKTQGESLTMRKMPAKMVDSPCPIERGMGLIGGRWKASILWHLRDGPVRFNQLFRLLVGASKKMVDHRLKEMEVAGLVCRKVLSDRPLAVTYELTPLGVSALAVLETLEDWVATHDL